MPLSRTAFLQRPNSWGQITIISDGSTHYTYSVYHYPLFRLKYDHETCAGQQEAECGNGRETTKIPRVRGTACLTFRVVLFGICWLLQVVSVGTIPIQ
jgi:hypothetical protein